MTNDGYRYKKYMKDNEKLNNMRQIHMIYSKDRDTKTYTAYKWTS
jgi:hypothetical protein